MLYNVSIYENTTERKVVPYMVKIEQDPQPSISVTDIMARDLDELPVELKMAQVGTGLMGEVLYEGEDLQGQASPRGGFYAAPLWLSTSTALHAPHPEKVWMVSPNSDFSGALGIVSEKGYGRRKDMGKLPGAVYMARAMGRFVECVHETLNTGTLETALTELNEHDQQNVLTCARFGVALKPYMTRDKYGVKKEGLRFTFLDKSALLMERHGPMSINLSDMTFGYKGANFVPLADECSRH